MPAAPLPPAPPAASRLSRRGRGGSGWRRSVLIVAVGEQRINSSRPLRKLDNLFMRSLRCNDTCAIQPGCRSRDSRVGRSWLSDRSGNLLLSQTVWFSLAVVVLASRNLQARDELRPTPRDGDQQPAAKSVGEPATVRLTFEVHVAPIIRANCVGCHNAKVRKGGLDLSSPADIQQGGDTGEVVVAGRPDKSRLFTLLRDGKMPPPKVEKRPTSDEVSLIRRWIADGAVSALVQTNDAVSDYQSVLSILRLRCTVCHGPRKQEGELRLDSLNHMLKGGKSGAALSARRAGESLLLSKVTSGAMPPRDKMLYAGVTPMTEAEIKAIARWIDRGAAEQPRVDDVATTEADVLVTDEDRQFWAFQTPRRAQLPRVEHPEKVRNALDQFLLAALESRQLTLSPEAAPLTLLRRVTFDLTGLPPTPAEVNSFLADTASGAYERLVDRLLASPQYGERWGRYWLDVAGYADSESKLNYDYIRHHAFRYRDYVIRSFNDDKPFDLFLTEQLAGDELIDADLTKSIQDEQIEPLVATGFLRMAPDPTDHELYDNIVGRLEVIADEIDIFASGILGLSMKCARCHDHKFDPLPQRDYFRLLAVFRGAFDEYDWAKPTMSRFLPIASAAEQKAVQEHNEPISKEVSAIQSEIEGLARPYKAKYFDEKLATLPDLLQEDLRKAFAAEPGKRDAVQKYLVEKFEPLLSISVASLKTQHDEFKTQIEPLEKRVSRLSQQSWSSPGIQALWDRGQPTPTQVYRRGDHLNRGGFVGPGVPSVLTDGKTPFAAEASRSGTTATSRRLALARWLTRPDHPLTSRVLANRMWRYHFGRGIVETLDNFGKMGARPSHPELLDWLAVEFVEYGWSMKHIHRLIVTSAAYRQSSQVGEEHERLDPENRFWSRMPLRRMEAEVLRDALLSVSGKLDPTPFGRPELVDVQPDGLVTALPAKAGWRRSVYLRQQRTAIPSLLEAFDMPGMIPNCVDRRESSMAPQALHLLNDEWVQQLAGEFARRVEREAGEDSAARLNYSYLVAFGRPITEAERAIGARRLSELAEAWRETLGDAAGTPAAAGAAQQHALETLAHALVNSAEFLYID